MNSPEKSEHNYASIVAELAVIMCGEAKKRRVRLGIRDRRIRSTWRGGASLFLTASGAIMCAGQPRQAASVLTGVSAAVWHFGLPVGRGSGEKGDEFFARRTSYPPLLPSW